MGVGEEAGGKQHNMTQAAPNELKLGQVGYDDKRWTTAR